MSQNNLVVVTQLFEKASQDPDLLKSLLEDILTPAEIDDLAQRWRIIKALHKNIPQRTIASELGVSLSKVTRGSRVLLNPKGGFNTLLRRFF
ncbi:helix-turn-helix domain-containing protein [Patescibacteria group bacterium]|nr:helix-turn-helix domain-containing protein [Patescibacteria group bacterium]MBP9710228.1 helix-turn-helix domain-containing protein [Patescibacteria group bacterium]